MIAKYKEISIMESIKVPIKPWFIIDKFNRIALIKNPRKAKLSIRNFKERILFQEIIAIIYKSPEIPAKIISR